MSLLDRFRPKWKHSDATVRAEAVRQLGPDSTDLLTETARTDTESRIRRIAIKKLEDPSVLLEIAGTEAEAPLARLAQERAYSLLVQRASGADEDAGRAALERLSEEHHLAEVASRGQSPKLRRRALERVTADAALGEVARKAQDGATRLAAVQRVGDPSVLRAVALEDEQSDVALAALERLDDPATLEAVAERARLKAVRRRAQERLEALRLPLPAAAPAPESPTEQPLTEEPQAAEEPPVEEPPVEEPPVEEPPAEEPPVEEPPAEEPPAEEPPAEEPPVEEPPIEEPPIEAGEEPEEPVHEEHDEDDTDEDEEPEEQEPAPAVSETESAERRARFEERREELEKLVARGKELAALEDLKESITGWKDLRKSWNSLSSDVELDPEMRQRFAAVREAMTQRQAEWRARQEQRRKDNLARLTGLANHLEQVLELEELPLKKTERRVHEAQIALKSPGPLPDKKEWPALKKRLEKILETLMPRLRAAEELDEWQRWANVPIQEALCERLEALAETEDLNHAARELRKAMEEWKKASRVPQSKSEELWERFKAARDKVRHRVDAFFSEQAKERKENLAKKEALCEQAEALSESTDWKKTAEELKHLQAEWKKVGPAPREHSNAVWKRFRKACDQFFNRRKEAFQEIHAERETNLARKVELCEKAEALADSTDWDATTNAFKTLQAEWKTVGAVPHKESDAVWRRFRKACDRFFDRRSRRDELNLDENVTRREELLAQFEALLPKAAPETPAAPEGQPEEAAAEGEAPAGEEAQTPEPPEDLADRVREAIAAWRTAGEVPDRRRRELVQRFEQLGAALMAAYPTALEGSELDPAVHRQKRIKLCERLEKLAEETRAQTDEAGPSLENLAEQLKQALASNTIRRGATSSASDLRDARRRQVEIAQSWRDLPGEPEADVAQRFRKANEDMTQLLKAAGG